MIDQNEILIRAIATLHNLISRIYKYSLKDKMLRPKDVKRISKYYRLAQAQENTKRSAKFVIKEENLFVELFDKNYEKGKAWNQVFKDTIKEYTEVAGEINFDLENEQPVEFNRNWVMKKRVKVPKRKRVIKGIYPKE